MSTPETTTETSSDSGAPSVPALPDYAPVPRSSLGPALNDQGYYVGRVERNLYWVTDGTYQAAFLTTPDGVVLLDAPPTIGHNLQRAVDEVAAANGVSNKVNYLIYSHHHADHGRNLQHEQQPPHPGRDGRGQRRRDPGDLEQRPGRERDGRGHHELDRQRDPPPERH